MQVARARTFPSALAGIIAAEAMIGHPGGKNIQWSFPPRTFFTEKKKVGARSGRKGGGEPQCSLTPEAEKLRARRRRRRRELFFHGVAGYTTQVGILRRRNAIHKILKFPHVVSRRERANERTSEQASVRPEREPSPRRRESNDNDVMYFRNRMCGLLARLRVAYISIFAAVSSSPLSGGR